jgi:RNA polymerase sigma factor (sigma-70 family)
MASEEFFNIDACLDRVRQRDETAARELIEHLYPQIIRIVRRHLPVRVAEEDLMQEVFIKIFSRLDQYNKKVPFSHWVSRVTVSTCIDRLRFERRRPEIRWTDLGEKESSALEATLRDETSMKSEDVLASREILEKLLSTLHIKERLVIQLLDLDGLSVSEIAQQTGWSKSLIKIRAFRARRKLRSQLKHLSLNRLL